MPLALLKAPYFLEFKSFQNKYHCSQFMDKESETEGVSTKLTNQVHTVIKWQR